MKLRGLATAFVLVTQAALEARAATCERWQQETFRVTAAGSNAMFLKTYGVAFIVNSKGDPSFTGGYIEISNGSRSFPLQFGLSGVINSEVEPAGTRTIHLAQYRSANNTTKTVVDLAVRWCEKEAKRDSTSRRTLPYPQGRPASRDVDLSGRVRDARVTRRPGTP
jgi:hypothetical protein